MGRVMQKGRAAFHRLQDAALAFDTQRLESNPLLLSDPAHQRFRLMDIEIVQDNMPLRGCRIAGNQALEVGEGILLGARWATGWLDDVPGHHIEIDKPGQRAMPDVLELTSQHMTWLHGQVRRLAFQGLHPGQLIHTDRALSALGPFGSTRIDLTAVADLLVPLRIGHLVQPVAEAVRLQAPFLTRYLACRGEICSTMPLFTSSSPISRPFHFLTRPSPFISLSQPTPS